MLRQLMRQARQRIAKGGSVIRTSVSTFMEFIGNNPNAFRLLLRNVPAHPRRFVPPWRVKFSIYRGTCRLFRNRKPYAARLYRSAG
jgi:hypothetical protein